MVLQFDGLRLRLVKCSFDIPMVSKHRDEKILNQSQIRIPNYSHYDYLAAILDRLQRLNGLIIPLINPNDCIPCNLEPLESVLHYNPWGVILY